MDPRTWQERVTEMGTRERDRGTMRQLLIFLLAWLAVVQVDAVQAAFATPPFTVPLDPSSAGSRIEREFRIPERQLYAFIVGFKYRERDQADRARARRLSGSYERDKNGKIITPGVAFSLRVTVVKTSPEGESTVIDREINVEEIALFSWSKDEFDKEMAALPLEKGRYRIVVETTKAAPEMKGAPIILSVHRAYRGK
ncbi:conserved hypothetical protein, putative exported protein [Cupriavidus taiwanensis]|nr:conserved hypothetical protein, putative exported protein [Cupriavidus taiwanensis]